MTQHRRLPSLTRRQALALLGGSTAAALGAGVLASREFDSATVSDFEALSRFERLPHNPIITLAMGDLGGNINGPSLIRVPDWIERPLGRYYLYFAHHRDTYIRLAYADAIHGPWTIYEPGTLRLDQTACYNHIASPDLHVDHDLRRIRLYFHGPTYRRGDPPPDTLDQEFGMLARQRSYVAVSADGLNFTAHPDPLGAPYFRVCRWRDYELALAMPGIIYRTRDGLAGFERGPTVLPDNTRHTAVLVRGDKLYVYFTRIGDAPERILLSRIDLRPDWLEWVASEPVEVLQPETPYEGVDLPVEPSLDSEISRPARQLRDPAVFEEGGHVYLLYAVAGEQGIAIARQR